MSYISDTVQLLLSGFRLSWTAPDSFGWFPTYFTRCQTILDYSSSHYLEVCQANSDCYMLFQTISEIVWISSTLRDITCYDTGSWIPDPGSDSILDPGSKIQSLKYWLQDYVGRFQTMLDSLGGHFQRARSPYKLVLRLQGSGFLCPQSSPSTTIGNCPLSWIQ